MAKLLFRVYRRADKSKNWKIVSNAAAAFRFCATRAATIDFIFLFALNEKLAPCTLNK